MSKAWYENTVSGAMLSSFSNVNVPSSSFFSTSNGRLKVAGEGHGQAARLLTLKHSLEQDDSIVNRGGIPNVAVF